VRHLELEKVENDDEAVIVWRLVPSRGDESCRWEAVDGRWISLTLGHGDDAGRVIVAHSDGRRQVAVSYEGALDLARLWRC
jgi:hypothetical protein